MAEVTVTEAKTVTEEVTKWKCEQCGAHMDRDEVTTVGYFDGTSTNVDDKIDAEHRCDECSGAGERRDLADMIETEVDWLETIGSAIGLTVRSAMIALSVGMTASLSWGVMIILFGSVKATIGSFISVISLTVLVGLIVSVILWAVYDYIIGRLDSIETGAEP